MVKTSKKKKAGLFEKPGRRKDVLKKKEMQMKFIQNGFASQLFAGTKSSIASSRPPLGKEKETLCDKLSSPAIMLSAAHMARIFFVMCVFFFAVSIFYRAAMKKTRKKSCSLRGIGTKCAAMNPSVSRVASTRRVELRCGRLLPDRREFSSCALRVLLHMNACLSRFASPMSKAVFL